MSAQSMLSSNASDSHGWEDPYIGCRVMPIKAEKFESYREIIEKLYVTERRPLEDVRRIMALEHNFYAKYGQFDPVPAKSTIANIGLCRFSNAQYKKRMRIWKMVKNIPKETMKPILQAQIRREAIHKQTTVRINGKVISDVKLKRGRRTSRFGKELAQQNPSSPINCKTLRL